MGKPTNPFDPEHDDAPRGRDVDDALLGAVARRALGHKLGALPSLVSASEALTDDLLLCYLDGALSDSERAKVEKSLLVDLDAKERLGILAGSLVETAFAHPNPARDTAFNRATQAVQRHVFHIADGFMELLRGTEGASALQPMTVRGAAAAHDPMRPSAFQIERQFQTASGPLAARFELHAERAGSSALVDLVVHVGDSAHPLEGVRCKLLRDGRPVDSREVEAAGCTFARLGAARYDVELRKGGVEIGRILFDLRG